MQHGPHSHEHHDQPEASVQSPDAHKKLAKENIHAIEDRKRDEVRDLLNLHS
jgi:hypothetical protein